MKKNGYNDIAPSENPAVIHFKGHSMFPFLRPGDRLIIEQRPSRPLRPGDIVLLGDNQSISHGYTAHRIIKKVKAKRFITKGDNMWLSDSATRAIDEIKGRVVLIIRNRRLISLTHGLYGRMGGLIAFLSKKNITPGLIASRLKRLREGAFDPIH